MNLLSVLFLVRKGPLGSRSSLVRRDLPSFFFSSKTKGPGKGPPEIIQKFRLRNWQISSADFPMTPMQGTEHTLVLFKRRALGQYPAAPCSPGPFGLLLTFCLFGDFPRNLGFSRLLWGFSGSFFGVLFLSGSQNGAFGKPCLCPARKRGFLTKTAKMTNLRSNQ